MITVFVRKGVGRKFSRGEGGEQRKKDRKLEKIPKNSTFCVFQGKGEATEKKTEKL